MKARILLLDVETSPHLGYVWGLFDQNVGLNQVHQEGYIMSFCAKWLGEKKITYVDTQKNSEEALIAKIVGMYDEADIVVGHNSNKFDNKWIMGRALLMGMAPPAPYRTVDTLQICRQNFKLTSNKLEYVADALGCSGKLKHKNFPGFLLWSECLKGNKKAWKEMKEYNIQDVISLEEVYLKLRSWNKNHPNVALYEEGSELHCGVCSSTNIQMRGTAVTAMQTYRRFQCQDCGKWGRVRKNSTDSDAKTRMGQNI